jgi:hypothetical protein
MRVHVSALVLFLCDLAEGLAFVFEELQLWYGEGARANMGRADILGSWRSWRGQCTSPPWNEPRRRPFSTIQERPGTARNA